MVQAMVSFETDQDADAVCPNCGGRGLSIFYGVEGIPVHSVLLMPSRDEARGYPRGALRLGFCRSCGFIANTRFDPRVHEYGQQYEETQGFSACFNAFAESLAKRLIDRYDLHGKDILEIGCGKGEFLIGLCRLTGNRGVGIDPAYVPGRTPAEMSSQVRFIRDFYSAKYGDVRADFVCCRHTLEHIGPTGAFVKLVRETMGDRRDVVVFFELPETMRVLREGAFWDVYYEHCSYFTGGSLARVFRSCGFEVVELYRDYDDQYLMLAGRPVDGPTEATFELENDLKAVSAAVADFGRVCSQRIGYWRRRVGGASAAGRRVVIWGSGSKGVAFLTTLGIEGEVGYVVDINPHRQGKYMPGSGHEIVGPAFLREYRPDLVIVMNPIYCEEIQRDLDRLGVRAELAAV